MLPSVILVKKTTFGLYTVNFTNVMHEYLTREIVKFILFEISQPEMLNVDTHGH